MAGTATFVLHTHLPYCRLAGRWPHGEEWIHEALLECYIPLLQGFQDLSRRVDGSLGVTMNITPILAEQLRDPLVQQHFSEYLGERQRRAHADTQRFDAGSQLQQTALFHEERYEAIHDAWTSLGGDVLGAFGALEALLQCDDVARSLVDHRPNSLSGACRGR